MVKESLQRLRAYYAENKGRLPSQQKIADMAGLSEATVQRTLSGQTDSAKFETIMRIAPVIGMQTSDLNITDESIESMDKADLMALVLALRKINIQELAAQREADDTRWRERLHSDQTKYEEEITTINREHAEEMRRLSQLHADEMKRANALHVEEMKRLNAEHTQEMKRATDSHESHVTQIHEMYARQMDSMRTVNARQIETMLEGHSQQIKNVQSLDQAQQQTVQEMARVQKEADEKSKEFLKSEIAQRDSRIAELDRRDKEKNRRDRVKNIIIFSLIALIFLLFFADFLMPSVGWIRRVTSTLFSYHHFG